ncbi:MAG: thioesterase family protein [Nitriliruptorales bacterium]|nr:thioesterase family protein [Nitriliruptorales bacterium]
MSQVRCPPVSGNHVSTSKPGDDAAFFTPEQDGRFTATELTRGPWSADAQHAGPPAALLGRAIERCGSSGEMEMMVARVVFDILRPVPITTFEVSASVRRPGRNVELVEASLAADGLEVMRAAAWRIRYADGEARRTRPTPAPPGPATVGPAGEFPGWPDVGYHMAMEWRFVAGSFTTAGPATAWLRMRHPLVVGEEPSALTRVLIAADSGNGVSGELSFRRFYSINTDLSVHLHRMPVGEWVCLDAVTTIDHDGVGLAASTISDERSVIGRGLQSLFVGRR